MPVNVRMSKSEFVAKIDSTIKVRLSVDKGQVKLMSAAYAGQMQNANPSTFTVVEGRRTLTVIFQATDPGAIAKLEEISAPANPRLMAETMARNGQMSTTIVGVAGDPLESITVRRRARRAVIKRAGA